MPGGWELIVIIGVLVLLFGAKRLPDMARSIGQSARVFKGEMKGMKDDNPPATPEQADPAAPAVPPAQLSPPANDATTNGATTDKAVPQEQPRPSSAGTGQ